MINYTKDKIIQEVQKKGISKCQEFLDKDKFKDLEKILINNKAEKSTKKSFFYRSKGKFLLKKLFNFDLLSFLDCLKLINLSKYLKLNQLSSEIRGRKTKLVSIDSYFSEVSSSRVLDGLRVIVVGAVIFYYAQVTNFGHQHFKGDFV